MKHAGTENKAASIEESITHAREAVQLDIRDGNSWCKSFVCFFAIC